VAALAMVLLSPASARAQSRGVWSIGFGAPPGPNSQDWDSTGRLSNPGHSIAYGPYQYYMNMPSILLTNDDPHPRNLHAPPPAWVAPPYEVVGPGKVDATALLRVQVPAEAEVWVSGQPTSQRGTQRQFVTPALVEGQTFSYDIRARWKQGGKEMERMQSVTVHSGDRVTVDFLRAAPTDDDPILIPPPRKLEKP
jgi:uncharacterized protein (TIGR03000 family)